MIILRKLYYHDYTSKPQGGGFALYPGSLHTPYTTGVLFDRVSLRKKMHNRGVDFWHFDLIKLIITKQPIILEPKKVVFFFN